MFQLSFLNTGLLIFAAATILPLIIWLLAKKKPRQIIFSSIRFIKRTEKEQKSRTQIKNILLLIIRMLIILLVVLAASRPSLRIPNLKPGKKHPPTAIAIVLDTSFSMDYTEDSKSTLEKAKAAILEINKRLTPQDLSVLITSDESWNRMHSQLQAGSLPENLINSLEITWLPLTLDKMLTLAETKLTESQYSNKEIYLLSDYQTQPLPEKTSIPVLLIETPKPASWENLSVSNAAPVMQLTDRQQVQNIKFDIINHGSSVRRDVLVRVDFNGIKAAEKFITLQPGQKLTETLPVQISASGWQSGFVEILDEKLTADNRSWFAFPFEAHPNVGVITNRTSLPLILQTMLSVYATPQGSVKMISPQQVSFQQLKNHSAIVVYDAGELTSRLREFLQESSKSGQGVLFITGENLQASWKSYFEQQFGVLPQQFNTSAAPISYVNPYHAITSLIDARQLARTTVTDFYKAKSSSSASVLLASEGSPLAAANAQGVLWLFNPASLQNRFFLEASFPVFAFRSLQYLSQSQFESEPMTVGQMLTADGITLPDGEQTELNGNAFRTYEPGVYTLTLSSGENRLAAIQPDYSESEFKPLELPKTVNYHLLGTKWQEQLFLARLGHDIWKYLLLAALFLFLIELILVKSEEWKSGAAKS